MFFAHKSDLCRTGLQKQSIAAFMILLTSLLLLSGCTGKGNLRFNDVSNVDEFNISGKISLPEIVETDLAASIRGSLTTISDFSNFKVSANGISVSASSDGSFSLKKVPVSDKLLVEASAGKLRLMKRLSLDDLYYTDLSNTIINLDSTVESLIWKKGLELGKNLTAADIRAREYADYVASVTTAFKLALQLTPSAVPTTVDELTAVVTPARSAASIILEREIVLREANKVLKNAFLRKDLELLKVYLSPSFSNDWDSTSSWQDFIDYYEDFFKEKTYSEVSWNLKDFEFLPDSKARVRTEVNVKVYHIASEQIVHDQNYLFDAIWRKEGSIWKVYRNLPYRATHPTQVGADARWGEIADAHRELQAALNTETLSVFENRVSTVFGNDFDVTSTQNDLLSTAKARFDSMDVKIATYTIDRIDFNGSDLATVHCRAEVKVINLIQGIDIDSGLVSASVIWRRENGNWKIYRNLPYRFSHLAR
ncbi:MAG: hypothetical protein Kow0029_28890 [Candidatus Rifleibacteriota bacterium]